MGTCTKLSISFRFCLPTCTCFSSNHFVQIAHHCHLLTPPHFLEHLRTLYVLLKETYNHTCCKFFNSSNNSRFPPHSFSPLFSCPLFFCSIPSLPPTHFSYSLPPSSQHTSVLSGFLRRDPTNGLHTHHLCSSSLSISLPSSRTPLPHSCTFLISTPLHPHCWWVSEQHGVCQNIYCLHYCCPSWYTGKRKVILT